jgi:hypothetical protein
MACASSTPAQPLRPNGGPTSGSLTAADRPYVSTTRWASALRTQGTDETGSGRGDLIGGAPIGRAVIDRMGDLVPR